jgi:hypothetical protein
MVVALMVNCTQNRKNNEDMIEVCVLRCAPI